MVSHHIQNDTERYFSSFIQVFFPFIFMHNSKQPHLRTCLDGAKLDNGKKGRLKGSHHLLWRFLMEGRENERFG